MRVVLNLYPFSQDFFLPLVYLVEEDAAGQLTHILKKATPEVLKSYGRALTPPLQALLSSVEALSPALLEKRFRPKKARAMPGLKELLQQEPTGRLIMSYVHRELGHLLSAAVSQNIPICLQAEKTALVQQALLEPIAEPLLACLFFRKTPRGMEYRLTIGTEAEQWPLHGHPLLPLTNTEPAWVAIRQRLFRVTGVNGKMLRPFLKKEVIEVPAAQMKAFFQKFILKAAARGHIEAEGFDVHTLSSFNRAHIELVDDPFQRSVWKLRLVFHYGEAEVLYADKRERITTLLEDEGVPGAFAVQVVQRDREREAELAARLCQYGLAEENRYFFLPAAGSLSELLEWLLAHRASLEGAGVGISAPVVSGRCLALLPGEVAFSAQAAGDWFDIKGTVQIGEYQVPFQDMVPYLRSGNPYYPLDDGLYFYIPEEWFSRYEAIAQHAERKGKRLVLSKALYSLLPQAQPKGSPAEPSFQPVNPEEVVFTPPKELKASLRPYQLYGVKWLIAHHKAGFGACLADDMGLGKTLQTIAVLLYLKQHGAVEEVAFTPPEPAGTFGQLSLFGDYRSEIRPLQALIILPTSLVFNWMRELNRFAPSLFVYAHVGSGRLRDLRAIAAHDVVLTTYHTARQDLNLLGRLCWSVIVLDESQQIKNHTSEVSRVVRSLQGRFKISLSGTPIENSLAELWTQMEFINPGALGSFKDFREIFLLPIEKHKNAVAKQRLFDIVRPFFLRRTKEEVAPDLPPVIEQVFYSEMTPEQYKAYERIKSAVRNEIFQLFDHPSSRAKVLSELMRLRQMANHPALLEADTSLRSGKFEDVLAQWENARRSGHKVLFFSSFEKHLRLFRAHFEARGYPFAWLTGDTEERQRALEIERFQSDASVQAFFMTLKAGGVGLNLTSADYIFLLDPWWNPAVEHQAIARAHRIGQSRPVTVLRFIARGSIEEKILVLQEQKRQLGQAFFDAPAPEVELSRDDIEILLE